MAIEAQLIGESGPTEVQISYVNAGSSLNIADHEVFAITADSGKPIASVAWASTQVATIGTCATDETLQILWEGRIKVPKDNTVALTQGHSAYWDASTNKATNATVANQSADFVLGMVVATAATTATEVIVDLNAGPNAYTAGA